VAGFRDVSVGTEEIATSQAGREGWGLTFKNVCNLRQQHRQSTTFQQDYLNLIRLIGFSFDQLLS